MAGEEEEKQSLRNHAAAIEARKDAEIAKKRVIDDLKYADELDKLSAEEHLLSNREKAAEAAKPTK